METNIFSALFKKENAEPKSWKFTGIEGLFADRYGNFWKDGKRIEKHYRPYQTYLLINKKQVGVETLRKLAVKINTDYSPF